MLGSLWLVIYVVNGLLSIVNYWLLSLMSYDYHWWIKPKIKCSFARNELKITDKKTYSKKFYLTRFVLYVMQTFNQVQSTVLKMKNDTQSFVKSRISSTHSSLHRWCIWANDTGWMQLWRIMNVNLYPFAQLSLDYD